MGFVTVLRITSHANPVPQRSVAAIIKSDASQFTSLVNCIAIAGINSKTAITIVMITALLFFMMFQYLFGTNI